MPNLLNMTKRFKPAYMLYNFFQWKKLKHNVAVYKKLGLRKWYFSPVSSLDFVGLDEKVSDFLLESEQNQANIFDKIPENYQPNVADWNENGFVILKNFFTDTQVEAVNSEITRLQNEGKAPFRYGNKIMFAFKNSEIIQKIATDSSLLNILHFLLKRKPILFQSINFLQGSEQATHSDSIHMTTYPLGGLAAIWVALEDITLENGPLHYYPKSHKLPYYLNADYYNEGSRFFLGQKTYSDYEAFIATKLADLKLEKQVFTAKKGDVFIWHANLFHGGEPHLNKAMTRKSLVLHYFSENTVCYHEITQRPALF
jgi:phytanoyl-CoA hydroxylase